MKNYLLPAVALASGLAAQAQSVYLPNAGEVIITPQYTYESYDRFWLGKEKFDIPRITQHTGLIQAEYGVCPAFALDLAVGYSTSSFHPAGPDPDDFDGLIDTLLGARWKFLDESKFECPLTPSLALRVGGIIEGSYDTSATLPHAPGDGASGFETSLLWGKQIGDTGLALFGDFGWRHRTEGVPEDLFGSAGLSYTLPARVTFNFAYRHNQGLSGDDIGDPGFTFPHLKEVWQRLEGGIGYTDKGGRYYQLFYARTIDGRNTGEKNIFGLSASFPFGGK